MGVEAVPRKRIQKHTHTHAHTHTHIHTHSCTRTHSYETQDGLAEKIGWNESMGVEGVPRKLRDAPFVQIPLGVTEDRLVGTVDIEASMKVSCRL